MDFGIADANNMGAAMAPAAFDTIAAHFRDTQTTEADFDAIYTGDLGKLGLSMLCDMLADEGAEDMTKFHDCGAEFMPHQIPIWGPAVADARYYAERKAAAQAMDGDWQSILFILQVLC
ncbi:MAG: hypothetical protein ACLUVV_00895 [Christensenellales bacterium]